MSAALTRREFGSALGGLVIAFSMAPRGGEAAESAPRLPGTLEANRRLDSWLRVDPVGTVTIFTGRVELGQGATTALAQIAAEELDITLARVRMIPVDTNRSPNEGVTAGSNSIEAGGAALRSAAAEARAILIQHASQHLGVPADQLIADDGTIFAKSGPQRTSYWELAAEMPLAREATNSVPAKPAKDHRLVGRPAQRLDIPDKVMGRPIFIQDMRLPGMLHGRIVRPPSYGAELLRLDEAAVRKLPGVVAVARDGRFLGVVAEREEQAIAARAALMKAATWRVPAGLPDAATVHDYLKTRPDIDTKTVNEKTASAPPAPGRFSTISGWPLANCAKPFDRLRDSVSAAPPAPTGTKRRTGRSGHCAADCANAGAAASVAMTIAASLETAVRCISLPPE